MKKKLFDLQGIRAIANTLTGTAKEFADAVVAAFDEAEAEEQEHDITSLKTKVEEIAARFAEQNEAVSEKINKVKNELLRVVNGSNDAKTKFTAKVCNEIGHALLYAANKAEAVKNVLDVAEANGISVARTKNDLGGLSFEAVVDYAIQFRQDDSDEVFDALYKTNRSKWFYVELDETDADQIAKQWNGLSETVTEKTIQDLAVSGKEISPKYVYKRQRISQEDLDDASEHGQEAALESDVRTELRKSVKALIVKSILVGDTVNGDGSKVTVFETIGTKTATDVFTTVLNPATANNVGLSDVRAAAAAVKTERKWLFLSSELKLNLARRLYAAGGTEFFFTDEELAAQLGVDKIVTKDYIASVNGLHAIVLDPNEYWVKASNEIDVAVPEFVKNVRNYLYELRSAGGVRGLRSTAVLREATNE